MDITIDYNQYRVKSMLSTLWFYKLNLSEISIPLNFLHKFDITNETFFVIAQSIYMATKITLSITIGCLLIGEYYK